MSEKTKPISRHSTKIAAAQKRIDDAAVAVSDAALSISSGRIADAREALDSAGRNLRGANVLIERLNGALLEVQMPDRALRGARTPGVIEGDDHE